MRPTNGTVGISDGDSPPGLNRVRRIGVWKLRDLFSEHAFDDPIQVCNPPGVDHLLPLGLSHRISGHCDGGQCSEILSAIHAQRPDDPDQTGQLLNGNPQISKPVHTSAIAVTEIGEPRSVSVTQWELA